MRSATQAEATSFTHHMMARFKGVLVQQEYISAIFKLSVGFDPSALINSTAITLGPLVWMKGGLSPDEQIEVATHEAQHLHDFWQKPIDVAWLYLASSEWRTGHEARAYRAGLELHYARYKQMPSLDAIVGPMRHGYALGAEDLKHAEKLMEIAGTTIASDPPIYSTEAGIAAIEYLKANAPDLLA
jgi:hypothetical protein